MFHIRFRLSYMAIVIQMFLHQPAHMLLILQITCKLILFIFHYPGKKCIPFIKIPKRDHMGRIQPAAELLLFKRRRYLHIIGNGYPGLITMVTCLINRIRMIKPIPSQIRFSFSQIIFLHKVVQKGIRM